LAAEIFGLLLLTFCLFLFLLFLFLSLSVILLACEANKRVYSPFEDTT